MLGNKSQSHKVSHQLTILQAVNGVGLTAVTTSRAVIVDMSSPVAGHVYDVISDGQTNDSDYTVCITTYVYYSLALIVLQNVSASWQIITYEI